MTDFDPAVSIILSLRDPTVVNSGRATLRRGDRDQLPQWPTLCEPGRWLALIGENGCELGSHHASRDERMK